MKLRVLRHYRCRELIYEPGVIDVTPTLGEWLLRDCPECFKRVEVIVETGALDAPPADKMMRKRRVKRG
jgi:hypothetical protein